MFGQAMGRNYYFIFLIFFGPDDSCRTMDYYKTGPNPNGELLVLQLYTAKFLLLSKQIVKFSRFIPWDTEEVGWAFQVLFDVLHRVGEKHIAYPPFLRSYLPNLRKNQLMLCLFIGQLSRVFLPCVNSVS